MVGWERGGYGDIMDEENKENQNEQNDQNNESHQDAIAVITAEFNKKIEDLEKRLKEKDEEHKKQIIEIIKGFKGDGAKQLSKEEEKMNRIIEEINNSRKFI